MRVFVILLLPLHRIWKIGRVIECAGLEIRYTPFGYRGFESLTFRKEKRMWQLSHPFFVVLNSCS